MYKARPLSALVLCGGAASRFGHDKGLALFHGEPLVVRQVALLADISDDVIISTNDPARYRFAGRRIVADLHPGQGPLAGLETGLRAAQHEYMAALACDMPFASRELFLHLRAVAEDFDVVIPVHDLVDATPLGRRCEPLHAIYRRRCLDAIEASLAAGDDRIVNFFPGVRVKMVPETEWRAICGRAEMTFANINTADDLRRFETS